MYPPLEPYQSGWLDTGDGHQLYWELCGNPDGLPAVFLHGGPGAGSPPAARRLFDPERFRLLVFDQRGSGRSRPHASLDKNETWDLVRDIETLRCSIGVERWLVFGGSWGSTLALAYGETHPQRVSGLILRGVFTGRQSEIDWIYGGGAGWIFPEAWEEFLGALDANERTNPVAAYYRRLNDPHGATREAAAIAWSKWESRIVQLANTDEVAESYAQPEFAVALALIEAHYMVHRAWLEEGQLLRNADRLAAIPGIIVQGRYDICTPPRSAWELHRAWPRSKLVMVQAGHRFDEPETLAGLVRATDEFATEALA